MGIPAFPPRSWRRFAAAACSLAIAIAASSADQSAKRRFDLPTDTADKSLRRFSQQSELEVVFASNAPSDVRTNPVHGQYLPGDAVKLLLAGTGLTATQDRASGAFMVHRAARAQKKNRDELEPTPPMNSHNSKTWLGGLLAAVAVSAPAGQASEARSRNDDAVQLSPFVVQSDRDTGYQATSTLAGTRLNTELKDLGAAISIYTKEFLDDIGATNSSELLVFATSMDAAGMGGNFSGATSDINAEGVSTNSRQDMQANSRSRGLSAPTFTRNFFIGLIDVDSYNTDRVTVLRGPNSALIGTSSPSGIVDTSLAQADLARHRNKVIFRVGNNGSVRAVADFNRVLIPNKLSGRVIGLEAREEYSQRPAFERKERIFGTVSYRPFPSTMLRANFESGNMKANQPIQILIQNSVTQAWLDAGRPAYDWTFYDDPARNPAAASQVSNNFIPLTMGITMLRTAGALLAVYDNPGDQMFSRALQASFPTTTGNVANAIRAGTFHPLLNRDLANDNGRFVSTRAITELPVAYWTGANVLPGQQPNFVPPGLKIQSFTDFNAFDWKNQMIDESARFSQNFQSGNFVLSQTAWQNRIGVELAYDTQRNYRRSYATFLNGNGARQTQVRIDTSVMTPEGLPNPNLGRPFLTAENFRYVKVFTDDETLRATAYARYDFRDFKRRWGRWVGRHTLSGVTERYRRDLLNASTRALYNGPALDSIGGNILGRQANLIVYLGPTLVGNNDPLRLEPVKIPAVGFGPYGEIATFVRAANATDPGTYVRSPGRLDEAIESGRATREVIKSRAFTLQSNWLDDHVATVLGWRRDIDYNINRGFSWVDQGLTNPSDPGQADWNFKEMGFPRTPPELIDAETKSYSVVLNWPRKLVRLPANSDLSVFYNRSDNFTPVGSRTDEYGRRIPPPKGITKEYGFNLSVLNNKFIIRGNRFENSARYLGFSGAAGSPAVLDMIRAIASWSEEGNTNPHLVASRNADIAKLEAALPPDILEIYKFRVTGTAPTIDALHENAPPAGRSDTADVTAKGMELEMVCNPTPSWRILFNIAKQETIKNNVNPVLREVVADLTPVWRELGDRPFGNYPLGHQLGQPLPSNVQTLAQRIDQTVTVPLATDMATEGMPSPEQRKWRANFVTSYTFGRGPILPDRLKGWSIGAGVRWQSRFAIGFPSGGLPNGVPVFDVAHPWYAPADLNVDGFVSYSRKIWNERIDWKLQLNATNLYQQHDLIPIQAQPWGQVASMRLAPERRWYLTNTFSF
jgi:outer membrane receptor protein involved in Fe transport